MKINLASLRPWSKRSKPPESPPATVRAVRWPLDMKLLSWNDQGDDVRLMDAVTGFQIWGATGSTKSSTTVALLNRAFLSNYLGGLYLTAKPDDPQNYVRQAEECGRAEDIVLFGPRHTTTLNLIEECLGDGGPGLAANVTSMLSTIAGMTLGSRAGSGREDGGFWEKMDNRLISSSVHLLMRSGEPVTTLNIERVVLSIPQSREQVGDPGWQGSAFVFALLRLAERNVVGAADREDVARLADYYLVELAQLGDRLRGTVQTSVCATLELFNAPLARRLLSSPDPTFSMKMLQDGKILIMDLPTMSGGVSARAIQCAVKFVFQLAQNRRDVAANPRPVALVSDESQTVIDLEHDAMFACTARSTRTVCLFATQSISNYLAQNGGANNEARVHALLGNLQCQVFHQSTDTKMVEYAQSLFGKRRLHLMQSGTQQQSADWVGKAVGMGNSASVSASVSEHLDHELQAEHFHCLAKGGPANGWLSQAIVYQGGKQFVASGKSYLLVQLQQRANSL